MNKSNKAALMREFCAISSFVWLIRIEIGTEDDVVSEVVLFDDDDNEAAAPPAAAVSFADRFVAAISTGLCDIDSKHRNIKCQV